MGKCFEHYIVSTIGLILELRTLTNSWALLVDLPAMTINLDIGIVKIALYSEYRPPSQSNYIKNFVYLITTTKLFHKIGTVYL